MEIGESSSKDIAINIKNELLKEEEESKAEAGKERRGYSPKKRKIGFELIHPEVPREDRIDFHDDLPSLRAELEVKKKHVEEAGLADVEARAQRLEFELAQLETIR